MKKRACLVVLALASMVVPATSCRCSRNEQQARPEVLAEQPLRLPNGLEVSLVAGPCGDTAALVVLLNVGIDHDPPGGSGMIHLVEYLLSTSASPGRAPRTVEAGSDHTTYSVVASGDALFNELDDVAAWMAHPTLTDADLGRARAHVLEELAKVKGGDATAMAKSFAEESVRPARGNGRRGGIAAEVEAIDLAGLQAFWQAHIKPGNARIVVTGRFDAEKVRARIEAAFAPVPAGTPPVIRDAADSTVKGTLVMGDAPTAVAVAVPAPALSDPLYPAFLVVAARLMDKAAPAHTWEATYDPIERPELLFITGPVPPGEQPEPGATRIRAEVTALLGRPLAPADIATARDRFQLFLGLHNLDPAVCAKDARAFAIARARRAQLKLDTVPLAPSLDATTAAQLDDAAKLFDAKHTAAVIAGGAIH